MKLLVFMICALLGRSSNASAKNKSGAARIVDRRANITYQGISSNGTASFFNIPFGKNTGGPRRFLPPQAFIPAPNTVFNATVAGAACPQPMIPFPGINGLLANVTNVSEDCLSLRVTKPAVTEPGVKLPVMVFIYGGGFSIGQAYDPLYDPEALVSNSIEDGTPVIYVAMNYRVGIFGFADAPALRNEKSLNVGLRDQRLALQWVQENIEVFSGDPKRVTIFGESAGGTSVMLQMTAFGGPNDFLFHQAIVESGFLGMGSATAYAANDTARAVNLAGCDDAHSEKSLTCLRSVPAKQLVDIMVQVGNEFGVFAGLDAFGPVVDGDFIPAVPSSLFKSGAFTHVPMILGWNEDDGSIFTPATVSTQSDLVIYLSKLAPGFSKSTINEILKLYPISDFQGFPAANLTAQWSRTSRIIRDIQFLCPSLFVTLQANNQNTSPIFLYHLNQTALGPLLDSQGFTFLGIPHTSDLNYVFDNVAKLDDSTSNVKLAKQMSGSWSRFARIGMPSSANEPSVQGWAPAFTMYGTPSSCINTRCQGWNPDFTNNEQARLSDASPGWSSDFTNNEKARLKDARVIVLGGGNPGLTALEGRNEALKKQKLVERCSFLMSDKVLHEMGT